MATTAEKLRSVRENNETPKDVRDFIDTLLEWDERLNNIEFPHISLEEWSLVTDLVDRVYEKWDNLPFRR